MQNNIYFPNWYSSLRLLERTKTVSDVSTKTVPSNRGNVAEHTLQTWLAQKPFNNAAELFSRRLASANLTLLQLYYLF